MAPGAPLKTLCLGILLIWTVESATIHQSSGLCHALPAPKNGNITCGVEGMDFLCRASCLNGFRFRTKEITVARACDTFAGTWYDGKEIPDCTPHCHPECLNRGCCVATGKCACLEGWKGTHCEKPSGHCQALPAPGNGIITCHETTFDLICNATCVPGFIFTNNETSVRKTCDLFDGTWFEGKDFPNCERACVPGCLNGGTCLGGNTCFCAHPWTGSHCQHKHPVCTAPDRPVHGQVQCFVNMTKVTCTATCHQGFQFTNGSAAIVKTCNINNGVWHESRSIPDCETACTPGCQNGGRCVAPNQCDCQQRWTGSHCQHSTKTDTTCPKSYYSNWVNKDGPDTGDGDYENMTTAELTAFCAGGIVTKVECYTVSGIPYYSSGEEMTCDLQNGLTCINKDNFPVPCSDYKIRYFCDCNSTVNYCPPGCLNGGRCIAPNQCSCPAGWKGSHCQHKASQEPWSQWINRNTNSSGDYEAMTKQEITVFCPGGSIDKVDCQTVGGIQSYSTGEMMECTPTKGLVCNNFDNFPILCSDYKIRYHCSG